jgi:hypothetical protein
MNTILFSIIGFLMLCQSKDVPLCQFNPFPLVLGENTTRSELRHLDYRSPDEILVAAGEVGSGTGMSLFSPSISGNNLKLIEFKWEMFITSADW